MTTGDVAMEGYPKILLHFKKMKGVNYIERMRENNLILLYGLYLIQKRICKMNRIV